MRAHCSSRNILGPVSKEARKIIFNCAFLRVLLAILDVDVGAARRPNMTARAVIAKIPEACVASVAMNTLTIFETFSMIAPARWRMHDRVPDRRVLLDGNAATASRPVT
jgi:hypothetical protein